MKKVLFALMVALATTLSFSSCSDSDEEIGLTDLLGSTFEGTFEDMGTTFSITFANSTEYTFTTSDGNSGTFTVANNTVTLTYTAGAASGTSETMTGDGHKKLIYQGITLKKQ